MLRPLQAYVNTKDDEEQESVLQLMICYMVDSEQKAMELKDHQDERYPKLEEAYRSMSSDNFAEYLAKADPGDFSMIIFYVRK